MNYQEKSIELHREKRGKISVESTFPLENSDDLSVAYTPGVAAVCEEIVNGTDAREFVTSKNSVAVVTDGSAVLGLGNIGPEAALPVMEGKAILFKKFAGVDAFPIALATQEVEEIIATVKAIAPTFGGINLEDISAPRCFEIEDRLKEELNIPVFHDDQHGTAIVVLAGLFNALKLTGKKKNDVRIVVSGVGAAGVAITRLLVFAGFKKPMVVDSKGIVSGCRTELNGAKENLLKCCINGELCGDFKDAIVGTDIFIGVSKAGLLTKDLVKTMAQNPIIFALANPEPEIMPEDAYEAGAAVVATGRSDYPNQVNNVLVFPGIFKGAFNAGVTKITDKMKLRAAHALADSVTEIRKDKIIPSVFDEDIAQIIADAVANSVE